MPIYGYRCKSCGHEFEILQKMSDKALTTCPKCSGELAKVMYPVGVVFKGSGFYSTDYKGSGKESSQVSDNGSDKATRNGAAAGSDGSRDSKSATEAKAESTTPKSDSTKEKAT
jgi:putative FmdB family regulatory protein